MDNVFALMGIVPSLASLDFSAQCHGEQLTQGDKTAKLVAPGFYFVVSPVIAMAGVTLMCALVAYGLVPLARRMGIDFNEMARKRKKREASPRVWCLKGMEKGDETWMRVGLLGPRGGAEEAATCS